MASIRWLLASSFKGSCLALDPEGRQRVNPAGLPEGGGAPDGSAASAHRAFLRRVHGRRAARHGL